MAQQLVAAGEIVVDVPATLTARTRLLSGKSGTKTDAHDARSVVIAARHHRALRQVVADDATAQLGLLLQHRGQLVAARQRVICQFHAVVADLVPGGAKTRLSSTGAAKLLRRVRPATPVHTTRKQLAKDLLDQWRWLTHRIRPVDHQLTTALASHNTSLTDIYGISTIGAATILSIVGDVSRFPTAGHFASVCGTAPIQASSGDVVKHRLSRRGNRQLNKILHTAATCQIRTDGPGRIYYQRRLAAGDTRMGALRKLKRQLANVVYRTLTHDQQVRCGQVETSPKAA